MTTNNVVKEIIIPETAASKTCYMESEFMQAIGGPQHATKLVSHAWKSPFLNTVLNIVLDAWGCSFGVLDQYVKGPSTWSANNVLHTNFDAAALLKELEKPENEAVLSKTYWLCIFAVNEHLNICGDCWECRLKPGTPTRTSAHFAADPCLCCGQPKFNPCICGSLKVAKHDPNYEIDKFDAVVQLMKGGLVVSLDPELETLKRVWVVAEIGESMKINCIQFQMVRGMGGEAQRKLENQQPVVPEVRNCDYTSKSDYDMILKKIDDAPGGQTAFNEFVWAMVELQFGVCHRLARIQGEALQALQRLVHLRMNFSWDRDLTSIGKWGSMHSLRGMMNLRQLSLCFSHCLKLTDVSAIEDGLEGMRNIEHLVLSFISCSLLANVSFGKGLKEMKGMRYLVMIFDGCAELTDVSSIGNALEEMKCIEHLEIRFGGCSKITDFSSIGHGFKEMTDVQYLALNFGGCSQLMDVTSIGHGLRKMKNMKHLKMNFDYCKQLVDVSSIGSSLEEMMVMQRLELSFNLCSQLLHVSSIGQGMEKMTGTQFLTMQFVGCSQLPWPEVSAIGNGLKQMRSIEHISLNFGGCDKIPMRVAKSFVGNFDAHRSALEAFSLGSTPCCR